MPARKTSNEAKDAQLVNDLPRGAKRVSRTTKEEFMENLDAPTDAGAARQADELDQDDVAELETDGEPVELEEVLSPIQSFLLSLRERGGDGAIRIYAIRKPDPVGLSFRNPCNTEYTAGDVPYDESDLSIEALEVAIQKLYGGGRYQIKVRQNGNYQGAITRNIRDLPEQQDRHGESAGQQQQFPPHYYQPQVEAPSPPQPQKTAREELQDVLSLAKDIINIRGGQQGQQLPPAPPPDPMATVNQTIGLIETMQSAMGRISPQPIGGERNWVDSIATLAEKTRIGDLIFSVGSMVTQAVIHNRAAAASNGKAADAKAPGAVAPGSAQPSASQAAGELAAPSIVGGDEAAGPSSTATPDQQAAVQLSPEEMGVLEFVVEQLRLYEQEEDTTEFDTYISRTAARVKTLPAETLALVKSQPSLFILVLLTQLRPDWADVADLRCGTDFIGCVKTAIFENEQGTELPTNEELADLLSTTDQTENLNGAQTITKDPKAEDAHERVGSPA